MKSYFTVCILAFLFTGITSCKSSGGGSTGTTIEQKTVAYTCPMHPDIKSDKPGKCPKCGMDLVKQK